ncbi:hypothetical protein WN944_021554 [Citrus x changshan-huyou]|uniref:Uncharacterized protein n=1 Tax=Citrus x changshan-huyou TaxID=2935761 RepID=A0AAP0MX12_9ROSI
MAHLNSAERDTSRKKQLAAVAAHLIGCFYLLTVTLATESSRFSNENGEDDAGFEEIVEAIREAADTTATEITESTNRTVEAIGQKIIKLWMRPNEEFFRMTTLAMKEKHKSPRCKIIWWISLSSIMCS